jgi:DNA-binding LacI/PurR family transcriptional regulator
VEERWIISDREKTGGLKLQELPGELPDAFVCNCDLAARALIDRLKERGIRVPEDIAVTGFDDFPPGSEEDIGLSTFRVDTDAMIEMAIKTILERCAGSDKPFGRMVIGGQPVYRVSG